MAEKKKSKYVSKGLVRNVSRKTLIELRAERKKVFNLRSWKARNDHRNFILSRHEPSYSKLRKRYEYEEFVSGRATDLFEQYKNAGITWAACVHAVKTDWVPKLHIKWGPRLKTRNSK